MSVLRHCNGPIAAAAFLALVLVPGCKGNDAPKTATNDRSPLETVTSDHGLTPYYYGLIEEYQSVLAEDPHNLAANIALGNALYDAGQWKDAIKYYDQALRLNPHNADVVTDKGTCYRNLGMTDAAVREYLEALRIDPAHQSALYNLGILYSHDKKDLVKAIEYWQRLLDIAPKHPQSDYIRASLDNFRRNLKRGAP
jgi:tetratricopeptide (TPR) repeat protein